MARTLAVFILLAPVFVSSYRPVHVPKNLFVQIPGREDGTRVIRQSAPLWQASPSEDDQPSVFNVRTRRATNGQPEVNEVSNSIWPPLEKNKGDDSLQNWPANCCVSHFSRSSQAVSIHCCRTGRVTVKRRAKYCCLVERRVELEVALFTSLRIMEGRGAT